MSYDEERMNDRSAFELARWIASLDSPWFLKEWLLPGKVSVEHRRVTADEILEEFDKWLEKEGK